MQYRGSLNWCLIKLDRCFYPKPQDKDPKECLSSWFVDWQLRENINQGPHPNQWTQKSWWSSPGHVCLGNSSGETTAPEKKWRLRHSFAVCSVSASASPQEYSAGQGTRFFTLAGFSIHCCRKHSDWHSSFFLAFHHTLKIKRETQFF